MADTRDFSSSMSTPQSGSANLNITVNGATTNYNPFGPNRTVNIDTTGGSANLNITVNGVTTNYNPFGPDRTVNIDMTGGGADVFVDAPVYLDAASVTQYDEGTAGQSKYIKCMELVGNGQLPICTARHKGPAGTHGAFGPLSFITDNCELCFSFPTFNLLTAPMILKLTSAGVWSKVTAK
ncbi:MAG: hypothetical protein KIG84_09090 [Bacteroidales bacterium]|nr:hypothetical protein [Bacteroidales bacterium]